MEIFVDRRVKKDGQARWPMIRQALLQLKLKCDNQTATVDSLKVEIIFFVYRNSKIDFFRRERSKVVLNALPISIV